MSLLQLITLTYFTLLKSSDCTSGWFTERTSVLNNAMQILDGNIVFNNTLKVNDNSSFDDTLTDFKRHKTLSRLWLDTPLGGNQYASPVKRKQFGDSDEGDYQQWLQVSIIIINKTPYSFKLEDRWNSDQSEWNPDSDDIALCIISGQIVKAKVMLSVSEFDTNTTLSEGMSYSISEKSDG